MKRRRSSTYVEPRAFLQSLFLTLIVFNGTLSITAQTSSVVVSDSTAVDSASTKFVEKNFIADDPVVAAMDSMLSLQLFESREFTMDTSELNLWGFHKDSVPEYADTILKQRICYLDSLTPMDLDFNADVKSYIELYSRYRRPLVSRMLGLSELYFPIFEEALDRHEMPMELKYLAIVESALNPNARSGSGAVGIWQFMYATGKYLGLDVTSYVDERRDPYLATEAACKYLKSLYNMYDDWMLALAAYNSGPGNVNKAIRRAGGVKNYWYVRPFLPRETRGYVPAFVAVNYVMSFASEHNIYPTKPKLAIWEVDTVMIHQPVSFEQVADYLKVDMDIMRFLNPVYKRGYVPYNDKEKDRFYLKLPVKAAGQFVYNEKKIYEHKRDVQKEKEIEMYSSQRIHVVRRGEVLGTIAQSYRCTVRELREWNNLRSSRIYPGQRLSIFVSGSMAQKLPAKKKTTTASASGGATGKTFKEGNYLVYVVQNGDTLWEIANRHKGVSVQQIRRLNNILNDKRLKPGMKIKIATAI